MLRKIVLLLIGLLPAVWGFGQHPAKPSLWHAISYLRDSSTGPLSQRHDSLLQLKPLVDNTWDSTHVALLRALARICYLQNNYEEAILHLRQAVKVITEKPGAKTKDTLLLPGIYYWLSQFNNALNNVAEELKALDSCAVIAARSKSINLAVFYATYRRAEYYYDMGDYPRCIELARACEDLAAQYMPKASSQKEQEDARSYVRSSFVWWMNSLARQGKYKEAGTLMDERLSKPELGRLANYLPLVHSLRAEMAAYQHEYPQSDTLFREAIAGELKDKNAFACKQLLNTMGRETYHKGYRNYEKALSAFRKALTMVNHDKRYIKEDSLESMSIWSNMAEVYVDKGMFNKAFSCFRKAWRFIGRDATMELMVNKPPAQFIEQKKIHYLTALMTGEGDARLRKYFASHDTADLRRAIDIYKKTDTFVNRIKQEQSNLNSKLFWRGNSQALYEHALQACYAADNKPDAFYFFEKSRAVLLNDQLAEQRWVGEEDIMALAQVRKNISLLHRQQETPGLTPARKAGLDATIALEQSKLKALANKVQAQNPFYYQSFIDQDFPGLQKVQQTLLRDYQALVEFFYGDSAVYMMVITAGDARLRTIDKKRFDSLATAFVDYLSHKGRQNGEWPIFAAVSHRLYELLFGKEPLPPGRIIISQDGKYFNVEALLVDVQAKEFFLAKHAVSYTYSARYLLNNFAILQPYRENNVKSFMGMAPVEYADTNLSDLKGSDIALEEVGKFYSQPRNFIGREATRDKFLQEYAHYQVIQLFTHAAGNREHEEPRIHFANGYLLLSQLKSEGRPFTVLVILTACETAVGEVYKREGVYNFNRAFAAQGIPAAITTSWEAEDTKMYKLMKRFHQHLAAHEPMDVALQKAKLDLIKEGEENALPYSWAVLELTGKIMPVTIDASHPEEGFPGRWIAGGIAALLTVVLLVRLARRKRMDKSK